jgi:uncharacterized SAM-binding protein YcdF (DUF218 family)
MWEVPPKPFSEVTGTYDYAIVLAGITKGSAGPADRVYFGRGADRATHTLQLYKLGLAKKVIVSGGSGRLDGGGVLEADELSTFLVLAGIHKDDIVLENRSQNTHQSAEEVAKILAGIGGSPRILLVTSGYHLRRAAACFQKAGLEVDTFSTDPYFVPGSYHLAALFIPSAEAFGIWQTLFKELVGTTVYWIMDYI